MKRLLLLSLMPILLFAIPDGMIIRDSGERVEIEWAAPDYETSYTEEGYLLFNIEGAIIEGEPGEPGIPRIGLTLLLPSQGEFNLTIDNIRWEALDNGILAPVNEWEGWPDGPFSPIFRPDEKIYSQNKWFPEEALTLFDAGYTRNLHLGELRIHPIRYNPRTGVVEKIASIVCRISFDYSPSRENLAPDDMEKALIARSVNPGLERESLRRKPARRIIEDIFDYSDQWFTFGVSTSGLYVIDRDYISSLGYSPSSVSPDDVRVFDDGWRELPTEIQGEQPQLKEIPLYAVGLSDGSFDSGDGLYFYARSPQGWYIYDGDPVHHFHRFANKNKYWIAVGGSFPSPARRLTGEDIDVDATPTTSGRFMHHVENDAIYAKTPNDIQWGQERTGNKNITYIDSRLDTTKTVTFSYRNVPVEGESIPLGDPIVNGYSPDSSSSRYYTFTGKYISSFTKGTNSIEIDFSGVSVLFDYYEFIYYIDLEPKSGMLTFAGSDTAAEYELSGFDDEPVVFDITDQTELRRLSATDSGETYHFGDTATNRIYFCSKISSAQRPESPASVSLGDLRDSLFACDMVMIIPEGLESDTAGSLQEFIVYKEALGVDVSWVFVEDVIAEFGFGVEDPTAIRDFLRYIWINSPDPPIYIMLVGDATWDPRGLTDPPETFCPAALCVTNAPDDYFYSVTETDYTGDFAGGRVPINTINEWRYFVDKVMEAESYPEYGPWRIRYVWCADDDRKTGNLPDIATHTNQTSNNIISMPSWADNRDVYMIDYPLTSTQLKPTAQAALLDRWNNGSVLVNYIGHGNYRLWSHEQVFEGTSCISRLHNDHKLPLVISASCEVGLFYRTSGQCIAEQVVLRQGSGAHSSIAATRMTMAPSNGSLDYNTIQNIWAGESATNLGIALKSAKGVSGYGSTQGQYVLFGDPSMRIGPPPLDVALEADPESLIAGRLIHVDGEVQQDSVLRDDFNGTAYIMVYNSGYWSTYISPYLSGTITYYTPGTKLFSGPVDVIDGRLEANFVMPTDISIGTSDAKITGYAYSDTEEGVGALSPLTLYGDTSLVITDSIPPDIDISLEGPGFCDEGVLCGDGILLATFFDSSGINTSGATGHGIIMTIDGNEASAVDLSPYFSYDKNSYTNGTAIYDIVNLEPGFHTVKIKAWDNMGNSSVAEFSFEVDDCELAISNPLAYPNPFDDETDITFTIDEPASVEVNIYTLSGRFVRKLQANIEPAFGIIHWDGKDTHGISVANGVYIVKLMANSDEGETVSSILKIAKTE